MKIEFNQDLIICRNCNEKIVWSDYSSNCVNCNKRNWGYTKSELAKACTGHSTVDLSEIICKKCEHLNTELNSLLCSECGEIKWGYNDFELCNGLINNGSTIKNEIEEPVIINSDVQEIADKKNVIHNDQLQRNVHEIKRTSEIDSVNKVITTPDSNINAKAKTISKILLYGILIGLLISFTITLLLFQNYESSIKASKAFVTVFKNDPVLNYEINLGNQKLNFDSSAFNWRLLANMGVLDWKSDKIDMSPKLDLALKSLPIKESRNVDVICNILGNMGQSENNESNTFANNQEIITHCLANGPNAKDELSRFGKKDTTLSKYSYFKFFLPFDFWYEKIAIQDLLAKLMHETSVDKKYKDLFPVVPPDSSGIELKDQYAQVNDFLLRLIISVYDDPEVKSAKNAFVIFVGTEQYFMYLIFGIGLMILINNFQYNRERKKGIQTNDGNRKFTVVVYKWIYIALPSIGFIGTKRGLSNALSSADSIVRATTGVNQSLAVSDVSDKMGIAFTSTLVGLSLLMVLMLFELFLRYYNTRWDE